MDKRSKTQTIGSALCALLLGLMMAFGCGGQSKPEQTTTKVPAAQDSGAEVSSKGKQWGGWRWEGDRDNCYFLVKNTCHPTEEAACKDAGCDEGKCKVDEEGAPAKVSCKE